MFIAHWIYRRSSFDQALDTSTTQRSFRLPHKQKQKILDKSIAVNTRRMAIANGHMDEKKIQCLSNASQHVPIYLQPFPSNSPVSSKVRHFSTFLHILAYTGKSKGKRRFV